MFACTRLVPNCLFRSCRKHFVNSCENSPRYFLELSAKSSNCRWWDSLMVWHLNPFSSRHCFWHIWQNHLSFWRPFDFILFPIHFGVPTSAFPIFPRKIWNESLRYCWDNTDNYTVETLHTQLSLASCCHLWMQMEFVCIWKTKHVCDCHKVNKLLAGKSVTWQKGWPIKHQYLKVVHAYLLRNTFTVELK